MPWLTGWMVGQTDRQINSHNPTTNVSFARGEKWPLIKVDWLLKNTSSTASTEPELSREDAAGEYW